MSNFIKFRDAVNAKIKTMEDSKSGLFLSSIDKKLIWECYLGSFVPGSNPVYLINTTHDCNCCKDFIRDLGRAVSIDDDNNIDTCWNIEINDAVYQKVADALHELVVSKHIDTIYKSSSLSLATKSNMGFEGEKSLITFDHFYYKLDNRYTSTTNRGEDMGHAKSDFKVLKRGVTELSLSAIETVIDLIDDNSLYLGEQNATKVKAFKVVYETYHSLHDDKKDNYLWSCVTTVHKSVLTLKNSAIGTLIENITISDDVETSVAKYESIVAPSNYKRPKSIVTEKMIKAAQTKVAELGISNSLQRRHANLDDITINNVIWADAETTAKINNSDVFDDMLSDIPKSLPKRAKEIDLHDFIDTVVPDAKSIELYLDNKHNNNMVTLVAPVFKDAPNILKWSNNFTWSYVGNMTDSSVKERVKSKGGNVDGDIRISLSWFNLDDLDIHMSLPSGRKVYFGNSQAGGFNLDVDMNVSRPVKDAVENICARDLSDIASGNYTVMVHNYHEREGNIDCGFNVEFEVLGELKTFSHHLNPGAGQIIECFTFNYDVNDGVKLVKSNISMSSVSCDIWGLGTKNYHNVGSIMYSPNHWDDNATGNRHVFFMLNDCKNPDSVRGFYNEYLSSELHKDRKVFEVLGNKMKAEPVDKQLSGVGFSTTKRGELFTALVKTESGSSVYNVKL